MAQMGGKTVKKKDTTTVNSKVTVIINDISIQGIVTIRFSQAMEVPENYTSFGNT